MGIETNGEAFYRAVAEKTEVAEVKALFGAVLSALVC